MLNLSNIHFVLKRVNEREINSFSLNTSFGTFPTLLSHYFLSGLIIWIFWVDFGDFLVDTHHDLQEISGVTVSANVLMKITCLR